MTWIAVAHDFRLGYQSDSPRDSLPSGVAHRMFDFVPSLDVSLDRRGGWEYASKDLNKVASCSAISGLAWAPFSLGTSPSAPCLIAVASNGEIFADATGDTTGGTYIANSTFLGPMTHSPVFSVAGGSEYMVLPAPRGETRDVGGITSNGSGGYTLTHPIGSGAPQACVAATFGEFLLLANGYISGVNYPNRIWISGVGDATSWTATGSDFFDIPGEIVAMIQIRAGLIVFGYTNTWLITGDTPPAGGNWDREIIMHGNGCMDARTVAVHQEYVIYANNTGVYKTDGIAPVDLTLEGGIKNRWRSLVSDFTPDEGWSASAGVYGNFYLIVIHDPNGNFVTCQVCDLTREVWFEFTNFPAAMFAYRAAGPGTSTKSSSEELFFASLNEARVNAVSNCFTAASNNPWDDDQNDIEPVLETPYWKPGGASKKQIKQGRFTYDLRMLDDRSDPYFGFEYVTSPEDEAAYTPLTSTLPSTSAVSRRSAQIRQRALGLGLRITQHGRSTATRLEDMELDLSLLEASR
jgi:hypothetical protein